MGRSPGIFSAHPRRGRRLASCLILLAVLAAATAVPAPAQDAEYEIKAAFLYNFAQFVKWPRGAMGDAQAPFVIGILGDDPFGPALDETVRGEAIDGHPMLVKHAASVEDLVDCQIIFVSQSQEALLSQILAALAGRPVLTVGDAAGFTRDGGDIDFYLANGRIRFEINPDAAQRSGLRISSQLLTLGRIVTP